MSRKSGSVRGAARKGRPYRDRSVGEIVRLKPGTSRIVSTIWFLGAVVEAVVDESVLEKDLTRSPSSKGKM